MQESESWKLEICQMKCVPRYITTSEGQKLRAIVFIPEYELETKWLDEIFGSEVGVDGLINTGKVEYRLSDGYGQHYLLVPRIDK